MSQPIKHDADVRRRVEAAIVRSPYGELLGVELDSVEPDRVRIRLPFRGQNVTFGDTVHGGAIASLVDTAATAACWSSPELEPGVRGTTIGFSLNFLAAGRGKALVADARVVKRGRSISVCEVAVADADGAEIARALVTYKLSAAPSAAER